VLVLGPYKILIFEDEHEDEYEKNQSRAALCGCQEIVARGRRPESLNP